MASIVGIISSRGLRIEALHRQPNKSKLGCASHNSH